MSPRPALIDMRPTCERCREKGRPSDAEYVVENGSVRESVCFGHIADGVADALQEADATWYDEGVVVVPLREEPLG